MNVYRPSHRHKKWWVEFKDHNGQRRRIPGFRSKSASLRRGQRVVELVGARINGDPPPPELAGWIMGLPDDIAGRLIQWRLIDRRRFESVKPIYKDPGLGGAPVDAGDAFESGMLLSDWHQSLIDDNNVAKYAGDQVGYVLRLFGDLNVVYAHEITAEPIKAALAARRRAGLSESGSNHYLQAVKQFCRWLKRTGLLVHNPVEHLDRVKTQAPPPHQRRPLTVDEFGALIRYLDGFERYHGQRARWTASDRQVIYWTAVSTGFRLNALKNLRRADFNLDDSASVQLPAHLSKNRRLHEIRLPADLSERLRVHLATKHPAELAFWFPSSDNGVTDMLRRDLAGAGVETQTEQGLIDFHAFRHTAITWWLDVYELNPRRVMELAHLSTLSLVMRYSRRFRLTDTSYIDRAPCFGTTQTEGLAAEA